MPLPPTPPAFTPPSTGGATLAWLRMAEALDERARALELVWGFARTLPSRPHLLDLGAGTGANLRYLLPRLGRRIQDWTLLEARGDLRDHLEGDVERWARANGWGMAHQEGRPLLFGDDLRSHLTPAGMALDQGLHHLGIQRHDGVTAHHFLHRMPAEWLVDFIAELGASGRLPLLVSGLPDGAPQWRPLDPDDALVAEALALGRFPGDPPLSPAAPPATDISATDQPVGLAAGKLLVEGLREAGYRVDGARADWRLDGARDGRRLRPLITALAELTGDLHPDSRERIDAWRQRRLDGLDRCTVVIPHLDLLAHQ